MKKALCLVAFAAVVGAVFPLVAAESPSPTDDLVTLHITQQTDPVFPQRMLDAAIRHGEARIIICVDPEGKLSDSLVVAYTNKSFADGALFALKTWHFAPPLLHEKPIGAITEITFSFELTGVIVREAPITAALSPTPAVVDSHYVYQPCSPSELDRKLVPTQVVSPAYPKELLDRKISGRVLVEFYVDETGRPRLAAASDSPDDTLAGSAIAAIEQWKFSPPTSKGKPVLVRASQEFVFDSDK